MVPYNQGHWQKRIKQYLRESWASEPSYFAMEAKPYLVSNSRILELGAGAGQDGLWFESQGFDVVITDADEVAFNEIRKKSKKATLPIKLDIQNKFPFDDDSFDAVYAQLVLHYFDDATTSFIFSEIKRVLTAGGILACMVNSTDDPEYDPTGETGDNLKNVEGLIKRYFTIETFKPFVGDFEALLFDTKGRTPKDEAKDTHQLIRYIGKNI